MKTLRCIGISDTHSHDLTKILAGRKADILFIAGDWSYKATFQEIANFKQELIDIRPQFKEICVISGNHELGMEDNPHIAQEIARDCGVQYLEESEVTLEIYDRKIRVWGSPATPWFGGWAYNYQRGPELAKHWEQIPEGLDVLMTHGPPNGINDMLPWSGERVGCLDLRNRLEEMMLPPRISLSGHLHCNYSGGVPTKLLTDNGKIVDCYNVSVCTEQYKPTNPPTEFYI